MNSSSLSRDYVTNQQSSSIKDDPFDLKDYFKGCEEVNYKRKLSDFAENLAVKYTRKNNEVYTLSLFYIPIHQRTKLMELYRNYIRSEPLLFRKPVKKIQDFLDDACNYYVHNIYNYEYYQANLEQDMYAY